MFIAKGIIPSRLFLCLVIIFRAKNLYVTGALNKTALLLIILIQVFYYSNVSTIEISRPKAVESLVKG